MLKLQKQQDPGDYLQFYLKLFKLKSVLTFCSLVSKLSWRESSPPHVQGLSSDELKIDREC
jgi:hypothetical protein